MYYSEDEHFLPVEAFFEKNGKGIIFVTAPEDPEESSFCHIYRHDLESGQNTLIRRIQLRDVAFECIHLIKYLEKDMYLWIPGVKNDDSLIYRRINIFTGERQYIGENKYVFNDGGEKFYYIEPIYEKDDDQYESFKFGEISTGRVLKERALFEVKKMHEDEEIFPVFSTPRKKNWFCYIRHNEDETVLEVVNSKGKRINSITLPPLEESNKMMFFTTHPSAWNASGNTLWLVLGNVGILEINIPDGCVTNLFPGAEFFFQISLSPAEDHFAFSGPGGLSIFETKSFDRRATFVPIIGSEEEGITAQPLEEVLRNFHDDEENIEVEE
ncbi:MAG TPA: hypothetical protein PLB62_10530 [Candidatus Sumerlaeota bacterium]|nr:hypothetical protein [Candidatus Sumerlaeota bacterium]